ncbi:hypothetical protein ACSMXN_07010 [Jatrophihabitans sp. DSM 45814]
MTPWADLTTIPGVRAAWAHSGLAVTADGEIIGFHAGQLVAFGLDGRVQRIVRSDLTEGHGITLVRDDGDDYLWIADPGFVFASTEGEGEAVWRPMFGGGIYREARNPRVVKMSLSGEIQLELPLPPTHASVPAGPMGEYCPCGTAVDEQRLGGGGDIWVADGYGSSLVHRFDRNGSHLMTLTGEEGAGRFACPHAVFIMRRPDSDAELYIADRENRRVQVYNLEGRYVRSFGDEFLSSPSGFAKWGETLVVAELYGRLALVDAHDTLLGYIGGPTSTTAPLGWPERPGWPNALSDEGHAVAAVPDDHQPFNSPHSVAVDADGNLYVSEWLLGGRYSKILGQPGS